MDSVLALFSLLLIGAGVIILVSVARRPVDQHSPLVIDARYRGKVAGIQGRYKDANPYPEGSRLARQWEEARAEAVQGIEAC